MSGYSQTFTNREGLEMSWCETLKTSTAWKIDGRGMVGGNTVYVGEADCDPQRRGRGLEIPHVILAVVSDIHHIVMTPDETDAVADALKRRAAAVREKLARNARYYAIQAEVAKDLETTP